jgi:HEAT repeat protein
VGTLTVFLSLLLSPTWGYLIDRFGSKPALRLLTLLLVPMPLAWLFITPEHPYVVTVPLFLMAGVIYGARNTMVMNLIYATSPRENRTMYVALHGVVFGLFGAIAPIAAGWVMHWLTGFVAYIGPLRIESFHVLCFVAMTVRILEQYLLGGFREPKSKSAFTLVRELSRANPFAVLPRAFAVMSSVPPGRKASAARKLGHSGSQLATRDLIGLLEDPNPHVREEAAMALGRTGDAEAVEPLVERLSDLDAEMRRQAAWALGQIGSGHAAERLIALLDDPYPHVRSAAAIALGQLGDGDAALALLEFFHQADEPLEIASAATALGLLGCAEALEPILDRLQESDQHVFRRQLAVAVGDLLGPAHAFYSVLDQELKVHGQRATRSIRQVRRAVRRTTADGKLPRELRKHLRAVEAAYLASEWAECARQLAAASEQFASGPEAFRAPRSLLAWLGRRADGAGLETCLLGIYALERIAQQTHTPPDA